MIVAGESCGLFRTLQECAYILPKKIPESWGVRQESVGEGKVLFDLGTRLQGTKSLGEPVFLNPA